MLKNDAAKQLKMKKVLLMFVIFVIWTSFALLESVQSTTDPFSAAGVLKFKEKISAPEFEITDIEGNRANLKHYRGKVVLLDFWTTW
jgi:cytochrome oxidase Cu insertion factor (SCO1/SenC/PrrC family)